jgi:hypothetical protein
VLAGARILLGVFNDENFAHAPPVDPTADTTIDLPLFAELKAQPFSSILAIVFTSFRCCAVAPKSTQTTTPRGSSWPSLSFVQRLHPIHIPFFNSLSLIKIKNAGNAVAITPAISLLPPTDTKT